MVVNEMPSKKHEAELFVAILESFWATGLVLKYEVAKQYGEIHKLRGQTKSESTRRAFSTLSRYVSEKSRPAAGIVWEIFESVRRAGVQWCSGFLGLFAAGYPDDVVGVLWCMRQHYYGDPWWADRLQALVVYAPLAIKGNLIGWEVDSASLTEARTICTLEEDLRNALEEAWKSWQSFDHRLESLCRYEDFPATAYARARDTRRDIRERETAIRADIFWVDWLLR
jgi:hypothetical protein